MKKRNEKKRGCLPGILCVIIIAALAVLAAGEYFFGWFGFLNRENESKVSGADTRESEFILMLDKCQFYVGDSDSAQATVICGGDVSGEVILRDETDKVCGSVEVDGPGTYYTEVSIDSSESRIGSLTALAEEQESNTVSLYVQPEVTDKQMKILTETAQGICEYMEGYEGKGYYTEEALKALERWLLQDPRVADVRTGDGYLLYLTSDGLAGSYGLGQHEEGTAGRASLREAFTEGQSGSSLSDTYVASDVTMTNTRITILDPGTGENDFTYVRAASQSALQRLADQIGGRVELYKDNTVAQAIESGSYADSGLVFFSTHGSLIEKTDGRQMLCFQLGELNAALFEGLTSETERDTAWESWDGFHGGEDIVPENFRLIYDVSPGMEEVYTVRATTNFIAQGLSDRLFDNTVIYFLVCYAASDTELINILDIHGASAFIGTRESFWIDYGGVVLEELVQVLGNSSESESEECRGIADAKCIGTLGDSETFEDMYYRYAADAMGMTYEEMLTQTGEADGLRREKTDLSYQDMANTLNDTVHEGGTDFIAQAYVFHSDNFFMTGYDLFSGAVTDQNGEPLEGVPVTLYRWLDHRFAETGSAATDKSGTYSFSSVPYGSYVVEAELGTVRGYLSLEFSPETEDITEIILNLTGIRGNVVDKENGDGISQATVQYTIENSTSSVSTGEGGSFYALGLEPGDYTFTASKRGYEDSEPVTVTLEKGEMLDLKEDLEMEKSLIPEDSWGNMAGMRGSVEYDYDEEGNVSEMRLINDATGNVYRRITYLWQENIRTCMTYGANGIALYSMTETYDMENGYLVMGYGQDQFKGGMSSSVTYSADEECEVVDHEIRNYRDWSDNYWITGYNEHGPEQTVIYFRDGARLSTMTYEYESDKNYTMKFVEMGTYRGIYRPVFDEEGRLEGYQKRDNDYLTWVFSYNEDGSLAEWIRYGSENEMHSRETFSYDADGSLAECAFRVAEYGTFEDYRFLFEGGNLIRRENLAPTIGEGDIDAMEYEYYENGVVKNLVCYSSVNPENADLEYIYSFYEEGNLKGEADYDYSYNTEDGSQTRHSGDTFRDVRHLNVYREDGTIKMSGTWKEETPEASGSMSGASYDINGDVADRYKEPFHGAIPSATEVEDVLRIIDTE